jgi:hypothetical protein
MARFEESNIEFIFGDDYEVIGSDQEANFKNVKKYLQGTKDVDFIGFFRNITVFLLEVKNFRGAKGEDIEILTTEVAQKLRDTVAMIAGAARNTTHSSDFWQKMHKNIGDSKREILYIFLLEEDVQQGNPRARGRIQQIQTVLKQKCKWLTPKIKVYSLDTCEQGGLSLRFLPQT